MVDSSWRTRVSHYLRRYFPIYKVELFEEIRREYEFGVGTIKGVAAKLKVHRRMVRQALASAEPPARKPVKRARPTMGRLTGFIDAILEADRTAPRKQRHTAHRIWQRIVTELPDWKVAEVSVRRYVRERKHELGWSTRTICVPQSYQPGQEGQVDWYEAWAELAGAPTLLQVFTLRSMASGAAFHRAYQRASAAGDKGYDASSSSGSNSGPTNKAFIDTVRARVKALREAEPALGDHRIPVDLVTASGSGLDPEISPAAAALQVPRVAKARGLDENAVQSLVNAHLRQRWIDLLGEPGVNVLELNLDLDARAANHQAGTAASNKGS